MPEYIDPLDSDAEKFVFLWRSVQRAVDERSMPRLQYWTAQILIHTQRLLDQENLPTISM